jgi:shikimate dehydrogenase
VTGARRGGAVLGSPIAHSLSPALHRAAYDALGLDDWTYRAVECDEEALAATLAALDAEGLAGVSLTMPLKRAVLPLASRVERLAADVGAANTLLFGGVDGEWWAANTDVPGMVTALRSGEVAELVTPEVLAEGEVVVLGGGATATSALAALRELGVGDAIVLARRPEATGELRAAAERLGVTPVVRAFADAPGLLGEASLVVSTVPSGAGDALAGELPPLVRGVLFDVVYAPWPTALAQAWLQRGAAVVGGLELLLAQAAGQVRLMTGREAPVAAMRAALPG